MAFQDADEHRLGRQRLAALAFSQVAVQQRDVVDKRVQERTRCAGWLKPMNVVQIDESGLSGLPAVPRSLNRDQCTFVDTGIEREV